MSIKRLTLDTITMTYTITLVAYTLSPLVGWHFSQEIFLTQFPMVMGLTAGIALLAAAAAAFAHIIGSPTLGTLLFEDQPRHVLHVVHLILIFVLTLWVSIVVTEASLYELFDTKGLEGALRLWNGLISPNWSLVRRAIAEVASTVLIAFLATVIAIPIAFFLAFFCAKNIMVSKPALVVYSILRIALNVTRSVEPLIWALIFTVWVGVGPFAGMLALMVHSIASLTKYYSEIIEGVDQGPIDGIRSTGANEIQVVWYAIVPQLLLPYLGMTLYRWDTNVRMATVIGLVGGGGIGTLLLQYQGQAMWPEVGAIILVIAIVVWLMDTASAYIREALK